LDITRNVPRGSSIAIAGGALYVSTASTILHVEVTMNTQEIAKSFTELCKAGKFDEAGHKFWADDVVSIEPMTGEMARLQGRKAVEGKGKWWADNHDVHSVKVDGPFVNGDEFTVGFEMEVTPKGKSRMTMREIGLYKVKNGKVVEEKFYGGD
jgi:hypothetical protein